jgi:3-oxoadipate enol-lactonase
MPEITLNDIKINYWEEGEGFPFIFIHGISDDSMLWSSLIPEFSKYYRTIALDIRGHGYYQAVFRRFTPIL